MDLLKKFLVALLFVFPLGAIIRIQLMNGVYVYPLDGVMLITFLYSVFLFFSQRKSIDTLAKAFLYLIGFAFVSLLLNAWWLGITHTIIASLYLLRLIMFASLIYTFRYVDKRFAHKYLTGMFMSGLVIVLLGFVQYIYYPNLRNLYYLGWDVHLYRMFSTFLDPNFAGAFFVLQSILTVFLLSQRKRGWAFYMLLLSLAVTLTAVLLSYSRTAYLMLIFSVPLSLILVKKIKYLLILIAFLVLGIILIPKNLHSEGVDLLRTASITARLEMYQEGLSVFYSSPVYGVGFDAYKYAREHLGYSISSVYPDHAAAGISNSYLFVLATSGVIGILLFLNIFRVIIVNSWRAIKQNKKSIALLALITTCAILIGNLTENIFFYESLMFWYFAVLGIWSSDYFKD